MNLSVFLLQFVGWIVRQFWSGPARTANLRPVYSWTAMAFSPRQSSVIVFCNQQVQLFVFCSSALCILFFCSLCFVLLWFGEAAAVIKGFTPFVVCGFWSFAELRSSALRLVRLNPQSVFFFLTFGNYSPSAHLLLSESQSASAVNSTHQLSAARVKRTPAGCSCPWCL